MNIARPFNSWDIVKLIALALMTVDHVGFFFFPEFPAFRTIGRGAPLVFFFLIGLAPTAHFKWDIVILAALMSASNFILSGSPQTQNILVTIILYRLVFSWLEHHNKRIQHPFKWFASCLVLMVSATFIQYGSIGFLCSLCGYLKRNQEHYSHAIRRNFWIASFVVYGFIMTFNLGAPYYLLITVVLGALYWLLWNMEIRNIGTNNIFTRTGAFIARYSAYVYAIQLIGLSWLTGKAF